MDVNDGVVATKKRVKENSEKVIEKKSVKKNKYNKENKMEKRDAGKRVEDGREEKKG